MSLQPIEIVPPPLFTEAVETVRARHGGKTKPTVDEVVSYEMSRVMKVLGEVNQPKGKRGHDTITKAEIAAASKRDEKIFWPLSLACEVLADKKPAGTTSTAALGKAVGEIMQGVNIVSESDSSVEFVTAGKVDDAWTPKSVMKTFASQIAATFDEQDGNLKDYTAEVSSSKESAKLFAEMTKGDDDPKSDYTVAAAAFAKLKPLFDANLSDVRFVRVGPKDEEGGMASDQGTYLKMFVGRTQDGKIAGVSFTVVET